MTTALFYHVIFKERLGIFAKWTKKFQGGLNLTWFFKKTSRSNLQNANIYPGQICKMQTYPGKNCEMQTYRVRYMVERSLMANWLANHKISDSVLLSVKDI